MCYPATQSQLCQYDPCLNYYLRPMLQNRVDPFGELIRTSARGTWTGTRGLIHNDKQEIVRPFKLKQWITCRLEFKGRKRKVMSPGLYTELFFLDEATALAAGHRPCCECRREDFNRFKSYWLEGNPGYHFEKKTSIRVIDDVIHEERMNGKKEKVTYEAPIHEIPSGSFISVDNKPYLLSEGKLFLWSPSGYDDGIDIPHLGMFEVLTPRSIVNTIRAGYVPLK